MEAQIYNQKGEIVKKIELPVRIFSAKWRPDLVHQVVEGMRSNKRAGTADTKDRGEVRGGGKKPWRQKGTGRARHGSIRSPIWVGGGVTHGPLSEKNYKRKISKKMRAQALFSVLTKKWQASQILLIDSFDISKIKTKEAEKIFQNLGKILGFKSLIKTKKSKILVALAKKDLVVFKSFRNLPFLDIVLIENLNPLDILNYQYLLIEDPEKSLDFLAKRGM